MAGGITRSLQRTMRMIKSIANTASSSQTTMIESAATQLTGFPASISRSASEKVA